MVGALLLLLGLAARPSLAFQVLDSLPPAALEEDCTHALAGDRCHRAVTYALERGVAEHPEWYPEFQRSSSNEGDSAERDFRSMQEVLHNLNKAGCGRPCPPGYVPPARTEGEPEIRPGAQQEARPEPEVQTQTELQTDAQETESRTPEPMTESQTEAQGFGRISSWAEEGEDHGPRGAEVVSTTPEPMTENRSMTDMSLDSLSKYLNDPRWRSEYEKQHPEPHWREEYEATVATAAALERRGEREEAPGERRGGEHHRP